MDPVTPKAKGKEPVKAPAKVLRPAMRIPWFLPAPLNTRNLGYCHLISRLSNYPPFFFPPLYLSSSESPFYSCEMQDHWSPYFTLSVLLSPYMAILSKSIWRRKSYIYPGRASSKRRYTNARNPFYFFASPLSITRRISFTQSLDFLLFIHISNFEERKETSESHSSHQGGIC